MNSGIMQYPRCPDIGVTAILDHPQMRLRQFRFLGLAFGATLRIGQFTLDLRPALFLGGDQPVRRRRKQIGDITRSDVSFPDYTDRDAQACGGALTLAPPLPVYTRGTAILPRNDQPARGSSMTA